ncbi:hypothetical protein H4219_001158 [Mycoemilia scoparia]|uniref:Eukaryotic translation initiation factor 2A n=1 Tax=Mycoemilia scoparia TaxID=417184 RepID=A0A9W8A7I1_9FUNG|nr:hypothetical protein H4219_001158 [Mycoemilia scoparia]
MSIQTQFAYRSSSELEVWNAPPNAGLCENFKKHTTSVKSIKYTPSGDLFACIHADSIQIYKTSNYELTASIERSGIVDTKFSPMGTYLMTWERFVKSEGDSVHRNLCVWTALTGELVASYTQKAQSNCFLQWTHDESHCAKMVNNEVHFYKAPGFGDKVAMKLVMAGASYFSISPGRSPAVGVFVPEKNGAPARVAIFYLGSFKIPVANKTFYRADRVEMVWNKLGTSMILITHTDVDKTNKSYYGESRMYFLATSGNFDCAISLKKDGPIHDVEWNPAEKEFAVVYGYMPPRTSLFDHRGKEIFDFGEAHRNYASFNPHGRVLLIGGFGNLSGDVDLWERKTLKKIATFNENGASICEWSPDGRYILAATLSPRLRVDNGIRVWHYSGELVYKKEINELFQVQWRPETVEKFPQRASLSPAPKHLVIESKPLKPVAEVKSSYVPPHLRNVAGKNPGAGASAVPGSNPQPEKKSGAKRNRKKSKKPKEKEGDDNSDAQPPAPANGNGPSSSPAPSEQSSVVDVSKRLRNLEKKLTQIRGLKKKKDSGVELDAAQEKKLANEGDILKEIKELSQKK